jgi:hypothetical protein
MSDPDKDWLDEEIAKLRDLQAPPTLLPKVMERVRSRSREPMLARFFASRTDLVRSLVIALSACLLAALTMLSASEYWPTLPIAPAFLRLVEALLESIKIILLQTRIYHLPLLVFLAPIVVFSYAFLVTAASIIKQLLALRK